MFDDNKKIDFQQYEFVKYFDEGSYGKVFLYQHKTNKELVAVKEINESNNQTSIFTVREINNTASIEHPSIIRYIGFCPKESSPNNKDTMVTEYYPKGNLKKFIEENRNNDHIWDQTKKLIIIYGIAAGMSYLHEHDIIHRDLASKNIFLDDNYYPKIGDLGFSKELNSILKSEACTKGTKMYLPKEVVLFLKEQDKTSDVYSFGVLVYEIITSKTPYKDCINDYNAFRDKLNKGIRPPFSDTIEKSFSDLIKRCCSENPEDRPTFKAISEELKTERKYIENVNTILFDQYVKYIEDGKKGFTQTQVVNFQIPISGLEKVYIQKYIEQSDKDKLFPTEEYKKLPEKCQRDVCNAEESAGSQYLIAVNLIEGKDDFPINKELGIKYLNSAIKKNHDKSKLYLCKMIIDGQITPPDLNKVKSLLSNLYQDNEEAFVLYRQYIKLRDDPKESIEFFKIGVKHNNPESFYKCGVYNFCKGGKDLAQARDYFEAAKQKGFYKSQLYLEVLDKMSQNQLFTKLATPIQHFFIKQIIKSNMNKQRQDELITNKEVFINSNYTQKFFSNKDFKDFISFLQTFESVSIEIFEGRNFDNIFSTISDIKRQSIQNIYLIISIPKTDTISTKFRSNTLINEIKIDPDVKNIESEAFKDCSSLVLVSIPSSLKKIEKKTFFGCSKLTKVTIPSSVESIQSDAFNGCASLTEITIPSSVTIIMSKAFSGCSSLANLTFEKNSSLKTIESNAFSGCSSLQEVSIPLSVEAIEEYCFSDCSKLAKARIPEAVKTIGKYLFQGCSKLDNFVIHPKVTCIEEFTFEGCTSLTSISIPTSVKTIGKGAFKRCTSLTEVKIINSEGNDKSSLETIEDNCFENCTSLSNISLPQSVKRIGCSAFSGCAKLTEITIDSSLATIEDNCFENCTSLSNISLPQSVKRIGCGAFNGCAKLTEITIDSSLATIEDNCFKDCVSLKKVSIKAPVSSISREAFSGCTELTEVTLPSTLKRLGKGTFKGCAKLVSIGLPPKLAEIDEYCFRSCTSLASLTIPSSVNRISGNAFCMCTSLAVILFEENSSLSSIPQHVFYQCSSLTRIDVPPLVLSIGMCAFYGCKALKEVTFAANVQSIGCGAFSECSNLQEIVIPSSVTKIEKCTFQGCTELAKVTIPSSVRQIGESAFKKCDKLAQVEVPSSIGQIPEDAFPKETKIIKK